jgi:preprotein translocase subunit SecE
VDQRSPSPQAPDDSLPQAEAVAAVAAASDGDGAGGTDDGFVASTLAELRKVVWPSRQQLFSESVAVILMVTLSAFAIAAVSRFYGWASSQIFR